MAVIKAVSSKAGIGTAINYVTKEEKTEQTLLSGLNCEPDTAKEEMQATKELWGKTDGRTYKHFVQSFAPDEKIDPVQAHQLACRLAAERPEWKGFEVLIATHKDREHKIAERKDRDIERERQSAEAKRRAEAAERAAKERAASHRAKSRGYGFER